MEMPTLYIAAYTYSIPSLAKANMPGSASSQFLNLIVSPASEGIFLLFAI